MGTLFREIKKHLYIYLMFIRFSVMSQMEYRSNFLGNMAMEMGYLCVKLSYVVVVYRSGVAINGLLPDEILLFIGTFIMLTGVYAGLYMLNNFGFRTKIINGELDLLMTKPVSLQFLATLRQADLTIFSVDVIAGFIVVVIAWSRLALPVTLLTLGSYVAFLGISCVVGYAIFFMPQILSFWMTNTSAIAMITDSFWDINSMPMGIYNDGVRFFGVFVLPVFVITNFPPLVLLGKMPVIYGAWSLVLPFGLLLIIRLAWNRGLRRYSSASS